jgi:hypothetical protein
LLRTSVIAWNERLAFVAELERRSHVGGRVLSVGDGIDRRLQQLGETLRLLRGLARPGLGRGGEALHLA